jgi:phage tail sheath protein FI
MAQNFRTPGVYVNELNAFPNSVVAVPTAIPVFIGYTQMSNAVPGSSPTPTQYVPVEITSLMQFEQFFGTGYTPTFTLTLIPAAGSSTSASTSTPALPDSFKSDKSYASSSLPPMPVLKLSGGATYTLTPGNDTAINTNVFQLYNAIQMFYLNGGSTCYIVSLGTYSSVTASPPQPDAKTVYPAVLAALELEPDPTMVLCPDALLYNSDDYHMIMQLVLEHCNKMQSRVGIFDVYDGAGANMLPGEDPSVGTGPGTSPAPIAVFRDGIGQNYLNYGIAYYPWVNTNLYSASDISFLNLDTATIKALGIALDPVDSTASPKVTGVLVPSWGVTPPATNEIFAEALELQKYSTGSTPLPKTLASPSGTLLTPAQVQAQLNTVIGTINNGLTTSFPDYALVMQAIATYLSIVPVAPAMAGVITATDNNVGPWQAPANVSLTAVTSPAVSLNDLLQQDMNVDAATGKSVNAIRFFRGMGTMVWGARTLAGNSQDWRYISVRRTAIFIEQSIKLALRGYVFKANDANTWVDVTSMINSFLSNLWSQGALAGSTAKQAYLVQVGLGSTMTADDILNGIMRVMVQAYIVHPAEFIELNFEQLMPTA